MLLLTGKSMQSNLVAPVETMRDPTDYNLLSKDLTI